MPQHRRRQSRTTASAVLAISGYKESDDGVWRTCRMAMPEMLVRSMAQVKQMLQVQEADQPRRALHKRTAACAGLRLRAKAKILELEGEWIHTNTARREWNPWNSVEVTTQHFITNSGSSSLWRRQTGSKGNIWTQNQKLGTNLLFLVTGNQAQRTSTAAKAKAGTSSLASRSNENLACGNSLSFLS